MPSMKKMVTILIVPLGIALVGFGFVTYAVLTACSGPVVKTNVGTFQGSRASDGDYDTFLGIPYAQVNMSNVFGPAIPQHKLDDVFIADDDTAICPQSEEFNKTITGSLDCLHLNVYTPKSAKIKHRHPVLVFIHDGDYKAGFGRTYLYGPKNFVKHGIVLVTLNYRLGPYGFLCSNETQVCNQGLKDQILALKWIKNNIAHFGGNPKRVTIAGVGSGGESVNLHLLYDKEKLFQNVIIESGIFLKDRKEGKTSPILDIADKLDFEAKNESEALDYLNSENIKSVIASSIKLNLNYGPCLEKESSNAYISHDPNYKNIGRVPILVGHSNNEKLRDYAQSDLDNREFSNLFNYEIAYHFNLNETLQKQMEKFTRNFYIRDSKVGENVKQKIVDFASDLHHNYPTKRMMDKYMQHSPKNVFYNVFTYTGGRNLAKSVYNISMNGATHGDVLGYLFDTPYVANVNDDDQLMIDRMTTMWVNFVKHGNPTPQRTALLPVKWQPVRKGKLNYLEISSTLTNKVTPFNNRTAYWDLFFKLNGKQERTTKFVEPWRM